MEERGYQENFYMLYPSLCTSENSMRKARKIRRLLKDYSTLTLNTCFCLDVGCSAGLITRTVSPLFRRTIGLDYDMTALAQIEKDVNERVFFLRGDGMVLPIADESIDVIICAQTYEHVPNDRKMFAEMERVLRHGGIIFFSGPNWLFPIEPHYKIPFLHWLPEKVADAYLKLLSRGNHYYERSRTYWDLRRIFQGYDICDVTIPVLRILDEEPSGKSGVQWFRKVPKPLWRLLTPIVPNFNWILTKRCDPNRKQLYEILD